MSNTSTVEALVKQELVASEIRRIKEKLRPVVRKKVEAHIKTKEFKKGLGTLIKNNLAEFVADDWERLIGHKKFNAICRKAVRSVIK